jgi:polyprenyldihydroxybenzoate methyltransferase / 3-demethylubiquinol 3-O-methyltransferase
MTISSSARSLNLRLLASLLRPTAAHISPPTIHLAHTTTSRRTFFTSNSLRQDAPPSSASSVSETEVSHFSRLAASWWDPHGPSRLLHLMNPLRHDFISSCLQSTPDPADPRTRYTYLDIGCGGGIFSSSAARIRPRHSLQSPKHTSEQTPPYQSQSSATSTAPLKASLSLHQQKVHQSQEQQQQT